MIDDILEQLISQLPESPTLLDKANTKKIHEYIPVPTDHKIRWADISSFEDIGRYRDYRPWLDCKSYT